jgi:ADP-heptose:LPS heptosyltransferase
MGYQLSAISRCLFALSEPVRRFGGDAIGGDVSDSLAAGFLQRQPQPPRSVVVVRASRIGDFLCATPAFRALRRALPEAEITFIGLPFVRDLVDRSSQLDRFVPFPGFPGMAEQFFDARRALAFFQQMQARQFDLAIQLHGSGVFSNAFTLMLGARATAGFIRAGDAPGRLDAALPWPTPGHEVDRCLALTTFLGASPDAAGTEFPLWAADRRAADALLAGAAPPLIGLHPGAREEGKRWPTARFAQVVEGLRRQSGGTVVVLGGPESVDIAAEVAARIGGDVRDLAGRTSLPVLGAVIDRLGVLVTNDSGPAHVAYALRAPTVTLFGPTDPVTWGPPTEGPFRVLAAPDGVAPSAMDQIAVPSVSAAAAQIMR